VGTTVVRTPPRFVRTPPETRVDEGIHTRGSVLGDVTVPGPASAVRAPYGFPFPIYRDRPEAGGLFVEGSFSNLGVHTRGAIPREQDKVTLAIPDVPAPEHQPIALRGFFDVDGGIAGSVLTTRRPPTVVGQILLPYREQEKSGVERILGMISPLEADPSAGRAGSYRARQGDLVINRLVRQDAVRDQSRAEKYLLESLNDAEESAEVGTHTKRRKNEVFHDLDGFVDQLLSNSDRPGSLVYRRPDYTGNDRLFSDLLAYAPGMNTSLADLRAVVEAEAAPSPRLAAGQIDPAARALIDRARAAGWQELRVAGDKDDKTGLALVFDGGGRYAYERTLPVGLRERVVCDGKTLLHLYPDLGVGARRAVSRFHRDDFADLVPWVVPPAEDLARGADVKMVGERTVAVVPHGVERNVPPTFVGPVRPVRYVRVHLVFDADGRLAGRDVVEMPAAKVLFRERYTAESGVRLLDADGKVVSVRKGTLRPAAAPDLTPDVKPYVVLPLPYRSPDHVRKTLKVENRRLEDLRFDDALVLLAAYVGAGDADQALKVYRESFHGRNQRQLGFYVLLAAAGVNLDAEHADVLAEHLDEPLGPYLALHTSPVLRRHASQWAVGTGQWRDGFLHRLALSHALYQRWQNGHPGRDAEQRRAERDRALDYVRRNAGTGFGWALLCLMEDQAGKEEALYRTLAEAWPLFADVPGLEYAARYEQARCLWKGGRRDEARRCFRDLCEQTFRKDLLPALDADFRAALLGNGTDADDWSALLRQSADHLVEKKHRPAVHVLARQCWELGDESLANHLVAAALERLPDGERVPLTLDGIAFFWETNQLAQVDRLLEGLLADERLARQPALWRLAARLAERREMPDRQLACLERALEVEYRSLPEFINLEALRRDYGNLLEQYQRLADAMKTLRVTPPADFAAKVVRAADRWRALDPESERPCQAAGRVLQTLGATDLVWDYLTTPVGRRPTEAGPWAGLARELTRQGDRDLADRAFAAAFAAEPTNAQYLWDRAQNLRQVGKRVEARRLYRQLAEGTWQPRFAWLQTQARTYLDEP
jgi:tetratricopeptide (TPR) repeat protein